MRRLKVCVDSWPECETGMYDPRCCRFPKSCSCTVYDPEHVKESDLEGSFFEQWSAVIATMGNR